MKLRAIILSCLTLYAYSAQADILGQTARKSLKNDPNGTEKVSFSVLGQAGVEVGEENTSTQAMTGFFMEGVSSSNNEWSLLFGISAETTKNFELGASNADEGADLIARGGGFPGVNIASTWDFHGYSYDGASTVRGALGIVSTVSWASSLWDLTVLNGDGVKDENLSTSGQVNIFAASFGVRWKLAEINLESMNSTLRANMDFSATYRGIVGESVEDEALIAIFKSADQNFGGFEFRTTLQIGDTIIGGKLTGLYSDDGGEINEVRGVFLSGVRGDWFSF